MKRAFLLMAIVVGGCSTDTDSEPKDAATCDLGDSVTITARPGELQADGSVTIYGSVRFLPGGGSLTERTVYAVYVADQEVQPAATDFNFRSWTVSVTGDRLAAFTTTAMDGSKTATLPVRASLHGGCVKDLETATQPVIHFPVSP